MQAEASDAAKRHKTDVQQAKRQEESLKSQVCPPTFPIPLKIFQGFVLMSSWHREDFLHVHLKILSMCHVSGHLKGPPVRPTVRALWR